MTMPKQLMKTWQMEAQENLFNYWADEIVQSLNQKQDSYMLKELIESLVRAAELSLEK